MLAAASSILLSVILGLLLIWNRGLYLDDYFTKRPTFNITTGDWQPSLSPLVEHARILGQLVQQNLAAAVPDYEFPVRLLWASVHVCCVVLLALIIYTVTESELLSIITAWFFLMPFIASEIMLWFAQVGQHGIGALLFLCACYLALRVIKGYQHAIRNSVLFALCVALGLQFSEMPAPVIGYPLLLTPVLMLLPSTHGKRLKCLGMAAGFTIVGLCICLIHYFVFLKPYLAGQGFSRGQVNLNLTFILTKYQEYVHSLYDITWRPDWGREIIKEAFNFGLMTTLANPLGVALLVLLVVACLIWIATVQLPHGPRGLQLAIAGALIVMAAPWVLAALLPGIPLTNQGLQSRMLYIAMAGVAVASAAFVWGVIVLLPEWLAPLRRAMLLIPATAMIFSTILMVGSCQLYKLRWQEDTRQVNALLEVVKPPLPQDNITFITPLPSDYYLVDPSSPKVGILNNLMLGVFDISWACEPVTQMAYRQETTTCINRNHWLEPLHVTLTPAADGTPAMLQVEYHQAPLDTFLAFTYHNGRVVLLNPLIVKGANGQVQQTIDLPLVQTYQKQGVHVEPAEVQPLVQ